MEKYSYGCKSLKFGECTGSHTMPASMEEKFNTFQNTVEFTEEDIKEYPQHNDQQDDPFCIIKQKGGKLIKAQTYDYSPETLQFLKGGTIVDGQWYEPALIPTNTKAVEIITDTDMPFQYPKAEVWAKFAAKFNKEGVKLLEVFIKPMAVSKDFGAVIIGKKTT